MSLAERALKAIQETFADEYLGSGEHAGQQWSHVKRERIVSILRMLRDDLKLNMLTDLTAVDHLDQGKTERFEVVYILYSFEHNENVRIKAWVPESDPSIDSVHELWKSAPWAEREVWDMFGITFNGHPDLKRILLPEGYKGHPLRKDYPLEGHGERHDFPRYRR